MAAQEGAKRRRPAAKPEEKTKAALEKAKAEAEAALTRTKDEEKARLKAEKALTEAQEALTAAQAELEQERQARGKAEKVLTEAQDTLATAQAEVEQERRARMKTEKALTEAQEALAAAQMEIEQERQARAKAEQARAEAERALEVEAEHTQRPPTVPGEEGAEQRVSFIVRLTVDERGQPRRTEVEHAQSGKKETFSGLDAQRLGAFMEGCIRPPVTPEPTIPPAPPPARVEAPTPEPLTPATSLTVSDVQVFRMGALGVAALALSPDEAFVVQARFQLRGPEAPSLTAQEPSFEIQVYAREVTSGKSTLLTTHWANLAKGDLEYTAQMKAPGLSLGLYHLVTVVTLRAPINMVDHHDGPMVHVSGVQPPVNLAAPLEVPLSR